MQAVYNNTSSGICIINEEILKSLYVKKNQMGGTCGTYRRQERCIQGFGCETERSRLLERPGHRWDDNIKMDLREVGWGDMD